MKPPQPLSFEGNVKENWNNWKQRFHLYLAATGLDSKPQARQVAICLHVIGEEALEKYNTFELSAEQRGKLEDVLKAFENYCLPKDNESVNRHMFFTRTQQPSENFMTFLTDLKKLSGCCEFGEIKDSLIRDRIICGINDSELKNRLLREGNLTLEKCVSMCKTEELARSQVKAIEEEVKVEAVMTSTSRECTRRQTEREQLGATSNQAINFQQQRKCTKCNRYHKFRQCPAFGKRCNKCQLFNHFAQVCKTKNVNHIQNQENDKVSDDMEPLYIGMIGTEQDLYHEWTENVIINNKATLKVKLDSGAQCNVISIKTLRKIGRGNVRLATTTTKLHAYGGTSLNVRGICNLSCKFENRETKNLKFVVIEEKSKVAYQTIIGLPSLLELKLVQRIHTVLKQTDPNDIVERYKDVFDGIGCVNNVEYEIKLKDDAKGTIMASRNIPIKLMKPLKEELVLMEKKGIIKKVTNPTDWVSQLVIANKPKGGLRICLDPTNLNANIRREHFHIPTFEEISAELAEAKWFSTLDANHAFWQIKLTEKSSDLVTFGTPFGRYKFMRMPYGISSASEIFQRCFMEMYGDVEGVSVYIDDVIIWGRNKMEHDKRLEEVLKIARDRNLKFNLNKCKISRNEVPFLGHIFSDQGIRLDENRIKAIKDMERPRNKQELETFLGIITYVSRFIPNVADKTVVLRNLTKRDAIWDWDANAEAAFKLLKETLIKRPVLRYYDPNKQVVLSVDASQHGLGCVLLQDNLPVAYGSKSLTKTECNYAQIEKEALAIAFGCSRFHQYIYGQTINVETDHKPLQVIFKKPLNQCPIRLQRILLRLQQYDLRVNYKPGKELLIADALSRAHLEDEYEDFQKEIADHECFFIESIPISKQKKGEFLKEIEVDEEMQLLKKIIEQGWPIEKALVPDLIKTYFTYKEEMNIVDGLIFKGQRLVIPKKLRKEMIEKVHYTHLGLEKCKNRAREILYWPTMNNEIENAIQNCKSCIKFKRANVKEPMIARDIPGGPWEVLGLDVFNYKDSEWLLVVDYYSKYIEVIKLENLMANTIIEKLKSIFARFGSPETIYSDNGTHFNNALFRRFADEWNFEFRTSSPRYPQSNGMVERHIGIVKHMFKKVDDDNKDLNVAMLEYRNIPIANNIPSPNELMFGRKTRGLLPHSMKLNRIDHNEIKQRLEDRQCIQKQYYDKNAHALIPLQVNDKVYVRKEPGKPLIPGTIKELGRRPRSYEVELEDGKKVDRNRRDIYRGPKEEVNVEMIPQTQNGNPELPSSASVEKNNRYITTRSGRVVKTPNWHKDYDVYE